MPIYDVYVFCDQCGQPHSVHVKLTLADENLDDVPYHRPADDSPEMKYLKSRTEAMGGSLSEVGPSATSPGVPSAGVHRVGVSTSGRSASDP